MSEQALDDSLFSARRLGLIHLPMHLRRMVAPHPEYLMAMAQYGRLGAVGLEADKVPAKVHLQSQEDAD